MFEIDDFRRKERQKSLDVLKCDYVGVGCPNNTQTPCCLRHWSIISGCGPFVLALI